MKKLDKEQLQAVDRICQLCWRGRDRAWQHKLNLIHSQFAELIDIKLVEDVNSYKENASDDEEFAKLWNSLGGYGDY